MDDQPLFVPVLLGTAREGRRSAHAARWLVKRAATRPGLETKLIDVRALGLPIASGVGAAPQLAADIARSDALILVVPEYNHGYPAALKQALDVNRREYVHKAAGMCGVSAGPFGGARAMENLLPVLRALGLSPIAWDLNISRIGTAFGADGSLLEPAYERRADKFLSELVWMATVLRHGRRHLSLDPGHS